MDTAALISIAIFIANAIVGVLSALTGRSVSQLDKKLDAIAADLKEHGETLVEHRGRLSTLEQLREEVSKLRHETRNTDQVLTLLREKISHLEDRKRR